MASLKDLLDQLGEDEFSALEAGNVRPETARYLIENVDEDQLAELDVMLGAPSNEAQLPSLSPAERELQGGIYGEVTEAPSTLEQAGRFAAKEGIPLATSALGTVGGAIAGGALGQPVLGAFAGGVAGETFGQEITQDLGLSPEQSALATGATALGTETIAAGAQQLLRGLLPLKAAKLFGVDPDQFLARQSLRERMVGEDSEDVFTSLEKLGVSPEARQGITVGQATEGVAAPLATSELAGLERAARSRGVKGAFAKADEQLRKELEQVVLNNQPPVSRGEGFSSRFKNIMNTRLTGIKEGLSIVGNRESALVNNSNATIDLGENLADAVDAFKLSVTNFDPVQKEYVFSEIRKVLPKDPTKMTLREADTLFSRLDGLSKEFNENKVAQKEISGILGRLNRDVFQPSLLADSQVKDDVGSYVALQKAKRNLMKQRESITTAKAAMREGLTTQQQAKKAVGDKQLLSSVFSSPESYRQFRDVLVESGDQSLLEDVSRAFSEDILNKIVKDASELGKKGAKELSATKLGAIVGDPNTAALIREIKGEDYLQNLQRVQNAVAARESNPILMRTLLGGEGEVEATFKELGLKYGLAKLTGHVLRAPTLLLAMMDKTVRNVMGMRGLSDEKLLTKLSDPKNIDKFDVLLNMEITNPKAYGVAQAFWRDLGFGGLQEVEWKNLVEMIEEGEFDTIPRDIAEQEFGNAQNQ